MMPAITYFILSLPVLCFSQLLPVIPIPNPIKAHALRTGCLDRFRNDYAIITFSDPSERRLVDYAITTKYRRYYPHLLRPALQAKNFYLTSLHDNKACDWQKARSVFGKAGFEYRSHHGDIYWKYGGDGEDNVSQNHTKLPNWEPEKKASRLPDNKTVDAISLILEFHEPAADVYAFCNILLWMLCCCLLFISVPLWFKACIECSTLDEADVEATKESEDIELQPIRAPVNVHTNVPDRVGVPPDLQKPIQTRCYNNLNQEQDTMPSEPPPSYFLDESSRES